VLRRVARDGPELFRGLDDSAPAAAALRHSYPDWLAVLWWEAYGAADARALLAAGNEPAEQALRVNRLRPGARERVERTLDAAAVHRHGDPELPDAVVLDDPFDVAASPLFRDGDVVPMSRAAQRVTALLDVQPGMRVLDACAAPGGKTGQLAVALEGRGRLVAVERDPSRARLLGETLARQGVEARLVQADAADLPAELGSFDAILLDAPCSGLGVVAGRPDLRWRRTPDTLAAARSTERALIEALLPRLAPGGRLLYAVCTLNPDEGRRLAAAYAPVRELETWPHRGDGDGFYAAVLEPG
jgi:16S rRNA (cytosine967-C5)-methyltransferase